MAQRQLDVTNTFLPSAFLAEAKQLLKVSRQFALVRSKNVEDKHDACWNDAMGSADPDCSICGGSGYVFDEFTAKVIIYEKEPHGMSDGAGSLQTQAGKIERVNAVMWTTPTYANKMFNDDIVIFPHTVRAHNPQVEYVIMNKVPYHIFGNRAMMYRFELFKTIGEQTRTTSGREI
jgi:hypothetical protein